MMFLNDEKASPIRSEFFDVPYSALGSAADPATAYMYAHLQRGSRIFFLSNDLDTDLVVLAVHPKADPSVVGNRYHWITVGAERVINYNFAGGSYGDLMFYPGTQFFLYCPAAPTAGTVKLHVWG